MRIIILGSAAGGGFPQWNCRCPNCRLAWAGDPRVSPRTQSSIAISVDGARWVLVNASPDLRQQILATPALHPRHGSRDTPIGAVVLTNGDVDHVAGLLTLRERQAFTLHASPQLHAMLDADPVFAVLDRSLVTRHAMKLGEASDIADLAITPFAVPGKVPLFLESGEVEIGGETEMTIGLEIVANGHRVVHIPGCAAVTPALRDRIAGADLLLFDGTTFTDDEMPRLGLSPNTATRMGHVAMSGPEGSLARLSDIDVGQKVYLHINNTNPVLVEGSRERGLVEAAGWRIAHDGMEIAL
ncbi:MAG: pyrroloquinoline quinone biosynthesis protein PqqB [Janthinobacterium lividum]